MAFRKVALWKVLFLSSTLHVLGQKTPTQPPTTEQPNLMSSILSSNSAGTVKVVATTVMSGTTNGSASSQNASTKEESTVAPLRPSTRATTALGPPESQTWNTSILCKHLANITGRKPMPGEENVVQEPIVAKCFPGFVCVNGICTGGMSCKCFDGWAGLFCQDPCPTDCAPGGSCMTSTNNQAICVCNETSRYTPGVGCVEKPPEFFTTTTPAPLTTPKGLRPLSERECFGAFTCVYGYCQFSSLECTCDPGWKGQLCDHPCELNCSGHGRCRENDEFVLQCLCDSNYVGEFCEIHVGRSQNTPAQNSSPPKDAQVDMSGWYDQNNAKAKPSPNIKEVESSGNNGTMAGSNGTGANLRPVSMRECLPGFVCQYGYCEKGQRSCVCDIGWGGVTCNLTCQLSCGSKGTCMVNKGNQPYCKCRHGYAGKLCQDSEADVTDPWVDLAVLHGLLSPLSQRRCSPGVVCAYGVCSQSVAGDEGCVCDPRFSGSFCHVPCPLACDTNRHCEYDAARQVPGCYCNHGYSGPNCTEETPGATSEPLSNVEIGLVSSAALLLLLLLGCVLLPAMLYRRGNIRVMKIVRSFQGYEEDDNKEYDAFILYVSADLDRQFVIQTLVPKLEGRMCLTLCIQQRSLVPTAPTTHNTVDLARQSRRIILIVSPSFISSSCSSEEYRTANMEMLREKQKIMLIILGDVNAAQNETDDAMCRILNSARKLTYPGKHGSQQDYNNFWNRLELSMPKKKLNSLESGQGQSCLVSPSICSSMEPTEDPKAPLEIRLFPNGNLNPQLMQRIVRVPAYSLDTSEKTPPVACSAFDRILGRTDDNNSDIQEDHVDTNAAPKDNYHKGRHLDLPYSNGIHNGVVNGGFNYFDRRHSNVL